MPWISLSKRSLIREKELKMGNISGIHTQFVAIGYGISGSVLYAAKLSLPVFLIAMLAYSYVKSVIEHRDFQIDYRPVIRTLILMFVVNFYGEIISMSCLLISGIINTVPNKPEIGDAILQMAEATMSSSKDADPSDDWWDPIVMGVESILSVRAWILSALQEGILFIVRAGISLIRSMLLVFLYIVGPIAIALSALPGFKASGLSWLKGFVGVQFWELSLRILDQLVFQYNLNGLQNFSADMQDAGYGLAFNLVALFMYLIVPSITNYFIHTGAAGGFMARIAQIGGAMLVMARMGAGPGAARRTIEESSKGPTLARGTSMLSASTSPASSPYQRQIPRPPSLSYTSSHPRVSYKRSDSPSSDKTANH